jgi:hypothetical protein
MLQFLGPNFWRDQMTARAQAAEVDTADRVLSRRGALIAGGAVLLGAGLFAAPAGAAGTKMAQSAVGYREKPQGNARCDGCIQWQAPASCKIVAGAINPSGWCTLYAPAPKS